MGSTSDRVEARGRGRVAQATRMTVAEKERAAVILRFTAARCQRDAAEAAMAMALTTLVELTGSRSAAAESVGVTPTEADVLLDGEAAL